MNRVFSTCLLLLISLLARAEPLVFTDIDGERHEPFAKKGTKAAVLVFVAVDCPIANFYQPTIRRLAERYKKQGVRFFQVHPDPDLKADEARKHSGEFGVTTPVVIDPAQRLVRRLDAKVTPEAFVLTPDGATAYRGRIDDTYTTYGKRRPEPTTRDLQVAIDAVLAGRKVSVPITKAIGCLIFVEE